jgi:hypothetical protein
MEGRRERPRVMGWLGVVAVLGNLLASVLCMVPAKAVASVDDLIGSFVLCTEHGPETLPASDASGGGGDQGDGRSSHCTACTLLAGLALLTTFVLAAIAFPARVVLPIKSSARTLADHLSLGGIRSRAPPLCA